MIVCTVHIVTLTWVNALYIRFRNRLFAFAVYKCHICTFHFTAAKKMSLPMTTGNDHTALRISMAENTSKEHIQGPLPLTHYNSENTVILENISDCDTPTLEMYIQTRTGCGKVRDHLKRSKISPSCALLTGLKGMYMKYQTARQWCLCRDGCGYLYYVIQWKTGASALHRE